MPIETVTIPGVPILRVGKGINGVGCPLAGCEYTLADLDSIAAAHAATRDALFVPVKLGHADSDGPASGWVEGVRRVGDRLIADLVAVPSHVVDMIRSRVYRARSAELAKNFKVGDRRYPLVLVGLALLGSDLPAVDGLGDIMFSHRHHQCDCPDPLEPTDDEMHIATQMGISREAIIAQKRRNRIEEIEGERQAVRMMQQFEKWR